MFSSNLGRLNAALHILKSQSTTPSNLLVIRGLEYLATNPHSYDGCINCETPFTKHFFQTLASLPTEDESHWLELLEDLVIFFREKILKQPHENVAEIETELINHFETSPEWLPEDCTLVCEWYWHTLPSNLNLTKA